MAKKEYPHNWEGVYDLPDEMFGEIDYEDIMYHCVTTWELPSSVDTIFRVTNNKTKQVKEYVYSKAGNAKNKLANLLKNNDCEILIMRDEEMYIISPNNAIKDLSGD